jgi:hypothetical protein
VLTAPGDPWSGYLELGRAGAIMVARNKFRRPRPAGWAAGKVATKPGAAMQPEFRGAGSPWRRHNMYSNLMISQPHTGEDCRACTETLKALKTTLAVNLTIQFSEAHSASKMPNTSVHPPAPQPTLYLPLGGPALGSAAQSTCASTTNTSTATARSPTCPLGCNPHLPAVRHALCSFE